MDSPESLPEAVSVPDVRLLRTLFSAQEDFRHKMGLQRRGFGDFYGPTAEAAAVRNEKTAILADDPLRYVLVSDDGLHAFDEFACHFESWSTVEGEMNEAGWRKATGVLSLHIEPDFMLLLPPDWRLVWASVCFPTRWSLEGKLHRPLQEIHSVVPGLNAEVGKKIDTFFSRVAPGEGWGRANWGLSATAARNQHPILAQPTLAADPPTDRVFIRVEDQHLFKLPQTGAMAFGIRVHSFRLSEALDDSFVEAGLRKKLETMPEDVAQYKGLAQYLTGKT